MPVDYSDVRTIDKTGSGVPHPRATRYAAYDGIAEEWLPDGHIDPVAGLVAARGEDHFQAKICNAADKPIGLFNKQKEHEPIVNLIKSTNHAETGRPVGIIARGDLCLFVLDADLTVVAGDDLHVIDGGFVDPAGAGALVAIAAEDLITDADHRQFILAWNLINRVTTGVLGP